MEERIEIDHFLPCMIEMNTHFGLRPRIIILYLQRTCLLPPKSFFYLKNSFGITKTEEKNIQKVLEENRSIFDIP